MTLAPVSGMIPDSMCKMRVCLWCGEKFVSQSPGHRKCPKCSRKRQRVPREYKAPKE